MNLQIFLKNLPLVCILGFNISPCSANLESCFDKAKLQTELGYQVKATSEFQSITKPVIDGMMSDYAERQRQEADDLEKAGHSQQAAQVREGAKAWETGGKYRQAVDSITNAVGLALGGKPAEGVIAGAASPYINEQIKQATKDIPELNIPAHMVWGAIEAELQGGSASSGAIAAGVGEAGAKYLSQALYGTDNPELLTEVQKKTVLDVSKIAGGVAAGLSSTMTNMESNAHSIASTVSDGMGIAENAVGNNFLLNKESERYLDRENKPLFKKLKENGVENVEKYQARFNQAKTEQERDQIINEYKQAVDKAGQVLVEMYKAGELSDDDYLNLRSSFADSMQKGIIDSQRRDESNPNRSYFEQDPLTRNGFFWTSAGLMNSEHILALEDAYLDKQVQAGKLSLKDKEIRQQRSKALAGELSDINFDPKEVIAGLSNSDMPLFLLKTPKKLNSNKSLQGTREDEHLNGVENLLKSQKEVTQHIEHIKDNSNLGRNNSSFNENLNISLNNRTKDYYINEQASKNVKNITAPIDFDNHILNTELSKRGKLTGGHSIANGNLNIISRGKEDSLGVYKAEISFKDPKTGKELTKSSTMFPDSWTANRVKHEVDSAYKNRVEFINKDGRSMWRGKTPSGVEVQGYLEPKTTAYPIMKYGE